MEKICPITEIISTLGKKWNLMILRTLNENGKKRFNELLNEIPGISSRTLSKRLKELEKAKLDFRAPELPNSESIWTIEYLDSKSGFREHVSALSSVHIPEGFVCEDFEQALFVGRRFMEQGRSCVIKSNTGESGWGTLILKKEEFNLLDFESSVRAVFAGDTIWNQLPLVVEEFINPLLSIAGGMPSAEAYIDPSGIKVTYTCGQDIIGGQGEFLGVSIGSEVLPTRLDKKIRSVIETIGQSFFKLGYRGFFDVDFVLNKNSIPYAIESNTRRTGGTHAYDLKQWLANSSKTEELYMLSYDSFTYGTGVLSPAEILKKSERLLFPMKEKSAGMVISFISSHDPVLGYVAIGQDKKQTERIRMDFLNLWQFSPSVDSINKQR